MNVRVADVNDARPIAQVHVDSWRSSYRGIIPDETLANISVERREVRWRTRLESDDRWPVTFVAEDAGDVVGFSSGGEAREPHFDHAGELYAIYLRSSVQRRGIGRELAAAVRDELTHAGLESWMVWVLTENHTARAFYETLGGKAVGRRTVTIGGKELGEIAYGWGGGNG